MSLCKGVGPIPPKKQKINGKRYTEDETIGVEDALYKILWSRYFIEAKGYKTAHRKLMQDNKSDILLEKNGRFSISKWTNHIKTRYLFVIGRVEQGDLEYNTVLWRGCGMT